MSDMSSVTHDILNCLANLSNDEVFTPPELANKMIDLLPSELFDSTKTTFLDPCCKSGVFLREIAKRLIASKTHKLAFEKENADALKALSEAERHQKRLDYIYHKQLFGIAITQLTALMSRRTLYCSKYPNTEYSISHFDDIDGNIRFNAIEHKWDNSGKCAYCGASKSNYGQEARGENRETHAYEFIHTNNPEKLWEENMKFDVIIGNPPYHMSDGGNNASAIPIYHQFVIKSIRLMPSYICMIIPSRWYAGGRQDKEFDGFRKSMIGLNVTNNQDAFGYIKELHDYASSNDVFSGIRNGGGICYFLWKSECLNNIKIRTRYVEYDKNQVVSDEQLSLSEFCRDGVCVFVRNYIARNVLRKVIKYHHEPVTWFDNKVYTQKPFGLRTNFIDFDKEGVKVYTKKDRENGFSYVKLEKITKNIDKIGDWKVVTSRSTSVPEEDNGQVLRMCQSFISEPNSVVTESYVMLRTFKTQKEAENCFSYVKTKFFRFLCQPTIVSPDVSTRTFILVPEQSYDESWDDSKLNTKYKLSRDEIEYIDRVIKAWN